MISPKMSYSLDNRHCAGDTKNGGEKQVIVGQRKTTTKAGEQAKRDQVTAATEVPILTTPITLSGGTFSALPTLLSFSFLPSGLLAST
jgi:hypothetical protein